MVRKSASSSPESSKYHKFREKTRFLWLFQSATTNNLYYADKEFALVFEKLGKNHKKERFRGFLWIFDFAPRGLPSESEKSSIKNAENVKNYGSTACDRAERLASGGGRQE